MKIVIDTADVEAQLNHLKVVHKQLHRNDPDRYLVEGKIQALEYVLTLGGTYE